MIHFCTVADSNYLLKGLAMYNSLVETMKVDYRLHWLCLDDKCYNKLEDMRVNDKINRIYLYKLSELENDYKELRTMKSNPATEYGDQYSNYCWSLTPWFIDLVLSIYANERIDTWVIYVDSDILFFRSPELIINAMGGKSVGIHTHRFTPPKYEVNTGWYNVGVVAFENTFKGRLVAERWKGWLIDTSNPYYKTHGKTGDQKYLELFDQITDSLCVFDEGTNLTHLAPWCTNIEPGKEIVFYHFSHFRYDLQNDGWSDSLHGEWNPAKEPGITDYYLRYMAAIKFASRQLVEKISIIGNIRIGDTNPERIKYLQACLKSFEFLKDHCEILLNIECENPAIKLIRGLIVDAGFQGRVFVNKQQNNYGYVYNYLLDMAKYDYVLNFIEDHFCVMDSVGQMQEILRTMREKNIDMMKASFHEVEMNSIARCSQITNRDHTGVYFLNDAHNFKKYSEYYNIRYYIGVNFLTTKNFAKKFWGRDFDSVRPHDWEIVEYDPEFEHSVLIPSFPVLGSIDDPHGEPGTELLKSNNKKWRSIWASL